MKKLSLTEATCLALEGKLVEDNVITKSDLENFLFDEFSSNKIDQRFIDSMKSFNIDQKFVIKNALKNGLSIEEIKSFANPKFSAEEMSNKANELMGNFKKEVDKTNKEDKKNRFMKDCIKYILAPHKNHLPTIWEIEQDFDYNCLNIVSYEYLSDILDPDFERHTDEGWLSEYTLDGYNRIEGQGQDWRVRLDDSDFDIYYASLAEILDIAKLNRDVDLMNSAIITEDEFYLLMHIEGLNEKTFSLFKKLSQKYGIDFINESAIKGMIANYSNDKKIEGKIKEQIIDDENNSSLAEQGKLPNKSKKKEKENINETDYRNCLARIHDLIRDEAFQIGDYGKVRMPKTSEQITYMINKIQKIQATFEKLKGIIM